MPTPIHAELANLSGSNPAGYISTQSFARLTLDRLVSRKTNEG
jgi:hypothetical protein